MHNSVLDTKITIFLRTLFLVARMMGEELGDERFGLGAMIKAHVIRPVLKAPSFDLDAR